MVASLLILAGPTCGSSASGGAKFCGEWAAAFCKRVWACTTDPASNPFAGTSEAQCTAGYTMLCSQPQPAGQTFDPSCVGKQVNEAAKTACLNRLNTVTCEDFNAPTYTDGCDQVCTVATSGTGGTGGTGGGGTGGGSGCGSVQPCGGDLVGTWTITSACTSPPTTNPNCPGGSVSDVSSSETGTLGFTAGGTYTANISATLSFTETTPSSCIAPSTCADLPYIYELLGGAANCTGTTTCVCSVAFALTGSEAGTYATSGTAVTLTSTAGDTDVMAYCVQGNTVNFLSYNSAGQVTTEEIAQRQ